MVNFAYITLVLFKQLYILNGEIIRQCLKLYSDLELIIVNIERIKNAHHTIPLFRNAHF